MMNNSSNNNTFDDEGGEGEENDRFDMISEQYFPPAPSSSGGLEEDDELDFQQTKKQKQQEVINRLRTELKKRDNTNAVRCLRLLVLLLLLCLASGLSAGLYLFATSNQQEDFETAFEVHANQLLESFSDTLERRLVALSTLSNSITRYVLTTPGVEWPFVTVPDFITAGFDARIQGNSPLVHFVPMVTDENRQQWEEEYAIQHRFHIDIAYEQDMAWRDTQDYQYNDQDDDDDEEVEEEGDGNKFRQRRQQQEDQQEKAESYNITIVEPDGSEYVVPVVDNVIQDGTKYHPKIHLPNGKRDVLPIGSGPFFPVWQRSPVNSNKQATLNRDIGRNTQLEGGVVQALMANPAGVILNKAMLGRVNNKNLLLSQFRHNFHVDKYIGDPESFLAYPIFDRYFNATQSIRYHQDHFVGMLATNFYWRLYFENVLPESMKGIVCVLENSFNQTFYYRVDGPEVTYLGHEDDNATQAQELYAPYQHMEISVENALSYVESRAKPETRSYNTVPLNTEFSQYTLRVYPTPDTEKQFTTHQPLVFTLAVAAVFVVTALVFIVFDTLVEKRQQYVMKQALQSGALVSSLFPETVQEKLYNQQLHRSQTRGTTPAAIQPKEESWRSSDHDAPASKHFGRGSQIAEVYDNTTIFFADLAGFTKWSSTRQPKDVFLLLESLYGAFDAIAERRDVYKIETIGDCYVAITGCPKAQDSHALIMIKFARDCMNKMHQLTHELAEALGEDTAELGFRVGLHSGSVTAGVLRGQKARFQLFGDAVKTASRMESNGVPGKIHVSQETADELIAAGKGAWLTPRQDKIVAKGKGEMQTYFVQVGSTSSSTRTTSVASGLQSTSSTGSLWQSTGVKR